MMLLLTLRGSPTLYYGDELGIALVEIEQSRIRDPWAKREPGIGVGRDPSRTPMQWDSTVFAGFSKHEPWLPITPDHATRNVAVMSDDETSILCLVRTLLYYRRRHVPLSRGSWYPLGGDDSILAYERRHGDDRIIIVLNFTAHPQVWPISAPSGLSVAISTHGDRRNELVQSSLRLRAHEGLVLEQK